MDDTVPRLEPQPPSRDPADSIHLESRMLQNLALDGDPDVVEPLDMKPATSLLRRLPVTEAAHADPVQAGARVEHRVRLLIEQTRQPAGQLLRLHPIPQRRHLQAMNPRARRPRRRQHLEGAGNLVPPAGLVHKPRRDIAAGNLDPLKVRGQPQPNLLRQNDRRRRRRRTGMHCRRRRQQQTGRNAQTQVGHPPLNPL